MSTPFTVGVVGALKQIGRGSPDVICSSESKDNFGNADVTLEVDGLRLHVVNDRGVQTLEVGLTVGDPAGPLAHSALTGFKDGAGSPTCPLEIMAVANGWIALEDLIEHYDLDGERSQDFAGTKKIVAPPFYEFSEAVSLLADSEKWTQLVAASRDHGLQMKAGAIEEVLQSRLEAALTHPTL